MCYCGTSLPYSDCCQPLHQGQAKAKTAAQLMRSRYCAFVVCDDAYLQFSHHGSTYQSELYATLAQDNPQWLRLEVLSSEEKGSQAWVEFKAFYVAGDGESCLHERSRFIRQAGHWKYVDGQHFE